MTLRPAPRLVLPLLLFCGLLPTAAGAAVRPPSDGQLRAAAGKLIPTGSALTDVSSPADLAAATRKLVVEFRPEDRGGAGAISRSTYDPADPLPINGLLLRATRSAGGALTYDLTAVSDSQPRFYIRGQKSGGQQVYLQVLSLTWQPLSEDSPEVGAWFDALQFSDHAFRVPPGTTAIAASNSALIRTIGTLTVVYKVYSYCIKISKPWFSPASWLLGLKKRCTKMLDRRSAQIIDLAFTADDANLINGALRRCPAAAVRRAWRKVTGYNAPPVVMLIHRALRRGC